MANYLSNRIKVVDTVGMVITIPTRILGAYLVPNAAGDTAVFNYFPMDPDNIVTDSAQSFLGTITAGTTITDDDAAANKLTVGRFVDGNALRIKQSTGALANLGLHLITTSGNDDRVICDALTNETSKVYSIDSLTARRAFELVSQATNKKGEWISFHVPMLVPNLALETISASAKVILYTD